MTKIVAKSRVHTHIIKYCTCPEAATADIQLFNMGLFLASFIEPKTAFIFDVLNDFILDNLKCRTSVMNYYSKLRRMTMSIFPHLVLDHYQELMRVARQWWKLKLLKWNGFNHEEKEVRLGNLAFFCLAYGNFKAEHLHATNPADEVSLMDSCGFKVGNALYKEHLAIAKDAMQHLECNNHRAGIHRVLTFYDVNCQYHKHLQDCIANSLLLKMHEELEITPSIRLWHVHGHQDSCYVKYASNFIQGTARIDGKIMETLWPMAWELLTKNNAWITK
ncbi:hypothetical protein BDR06DRAFT_981587 [Suillus hirtellus]|nr:hypothetical protein BDR06DRAFT_981587 [Suillus hirtellus]